MKDQAMPSLEGQIPGKATSFAKLIGFEVDLLEPWHCRLSLVVRDELKQPEGILHGGVTASLMDTAVAYALYAAIGHETQFATSELTIYYLAPIREGTILTEATIIQHTRRTALGEATVHTSDGKLAAKAMTRYLLRRRSES